jgi:hypothetical protein
MSHDFWTIGVPQKSFHHIDKFTYIQIPTYDHNRQWQNPSNGGIASEAL